MKPFPTLTLSIVLLLLVLSACGGAVLEQAPRPETNISKPDPTLAPPLPTPEISVIEQTPADDTNAVPRELAEKARADLAGYLNIDMDRIRVVESRAVDWPDASLGCPQPGMTYAQGITPGYYLVLEAGGQRYPYHTDKDDQVTLCLGNVLDLDSETPLPEIPVNPDEIKDGKPWVPVD